MEGIIVDALTTSAHEEWASICVEPVSAHGSDNQIGQKIFWEANMLGFMRKAGCLLPRESKKRIA